MSYSYFISRRADATAVPFSVDEMRGLADSDPGWISVPPAESDELWQFIRRGKSGDLRLFLEDGELVFNDVLHEEKLRELQELAVGLRARVFGDEGKDLTSAKIGESWLKKALIVAIGLAGAALLIWADRILRTR